MTKKQQKDLFDKEYVKWHQFLLDQQNNYEGHLRLSYEKRIELEKKVTALVDFCNENGIYMHDKNDIAQFMISLKGNGSRELSPDGFSICTRESCYASIHLDETLEEIDAHAKRLAQSDVDYAILDEKEKRKAEARKKEEEKRSEECKKWIKEATEARSRRERQQAIEELDELRKEGCPYVSPKSHEAAIKRAKEFNEFVRRDIKRQEEAAKSIVPKTEEEKKQEKLDELKRKSIAQAHELGELLAARREKLDEDAVELEQDRMAKLANDVYEKLHGSKNPDTIAQILVEQVNAYANLKDYDALSDFDFSMCSHDELEAVDNYILQCQRFTDGQNAGLTGLGLYTFNNDRMAAHEEMLEAWGLRDDPVALDATRSFDFCSDWNHKTHKYDARPKEEAELMLCWVLWKCRNLKNYDED